MTDTPLDFDTINSALEPYAEMDSASFLQGMLYGLRCAKNDLTTTGWVKQVLDEIQIKSVKESFLKLLQQLYISSESAMKGPGFELDLCLPSENESLSLRAAMLSQWCEGFLYGFGLMGRSQEVLTAEARELLRDFSQIASLEVEGQDDADEEDEANYMELVEFVRIGVLSLNEELNPVKGSPIMTQQPPTDTLH